MESRSRQRWIGEEEPPTITTKTSQARTRRHGSTAGLSVAASGNIMPVRNETRPETATVAAIDQDRLINHERNARFTPTARSSAVMMDYSLPSSPTVAASSKTRLKELDIDAGSAAADTSETVNGTARRRPSTRALSSEAVKASRGMLGRRSSRSNNESLQTTSSFSASPASAVNAYPNAPIDTTAQSPSTSRARTRTLDDRRSVVRSPLSSAHQQRQRVGSINTPPLASSGPALSPTAASHVQPADYVTIPIASAPPARQRSDTNSSNRQTTSAADHSTATYNTLPARRQQLNKPQLGSMSGILVFRRNAQTPWAERRCFIQEETASLIYESSAGDGSHRTLIPDLRGCQIDFGRTEDNIPYIVVRTPRSGSEVHIRFLSQSDFDQWIAALLSWQNNRHQKERTSQVMPSTSPAAVPVPTMPPPPPPQSPRRASNARSISPRNRKRADSDRSQHRRKSVVMSLKEAPVIKIGKMIFWDTDVTYNAASSSSLAVGQPATGRPQVHRMQSYGSRRWRRISALLRENGELKLHADHDNSLLSVVQLSQLSRCAIQRLDQSVLDNEFCIAIYPQYTSTPTDSVNVLRPIFLSLESRVLHEVWFVLLRAFTIPQLYGPRSAEDFNSDTQSPDRDIEKLLAEQTTDMFRMERSLSIRVVEAKLYPPQTVEPPSSRGAHNIKPEQFAYHVELLLDNETRAKTAVKSEGLNPLWGETFDFADLPPVLTSASIVIKRRPLEAVKMAHDGRMTVDSSTFSNGAQGGFSGINYDVTCGKVEVYLDELGAANEAEKWWPVVNMFNHRVGEVLIKARADEGVVLMARDYQPLSDLLHKFSNGLSLQLAQIVPGELKRLSDCLLNIYQVSGKAGDWIMALVEDEIDSVQKETPISRLRFTGRGGDSHDHYGLSSGHSDRELMVRDMNKNATLEANLLFRGNTLLTKSLDSHMRRVGKDFLEEALAVKLKEICERDPDCEVDPNRASESEVSRNWRKLIAITSEVWKSILAAKQKCPIELRRIFRHIRACAEDRYGDFLRSVSYSSVSGFLFLRFFCPAVLNPKLFGLFKDDIKPKGRRTLTLIAKSLQTLANMTSFGTKEQWMEPMNIFLNQSREAFKNFIDDICYVPPPMTAGTPTSPAAMPPKIVSADTNLSYATPMTIMQRLPPTSREGFPSLPYLIDQPRAFAELVQLWLETTSNASSTRDMAFPGKSKADLLAAIRQTDGDVRQFHDVCVKLNARTQECLSRAERAERPHSALSFQWEELIDQLQTPTDQDTSALESNGDVDPRVETLIGTLSSQDRSRSTSAVFESRSADPQVGILRDTFEATGVTRDVSSRYGASRMLHSRDTESPSSPTSVDVSSSTMSSDAEYSTTALPNYDKELAYGRRHQQPPEEQPLQQQQQQQHHDKSNKEHAERRGQGIKFVSALRKKRGDKDYSANNGNNGTV